jgi:hypothetical protein
MSAEVEIMRLRKELMRISNLNIFLIFTLDKISKQKSSDDSDTRSSLTAKLALDKIRKSEFTIRPNINNKEVLQ